MPLAWLHWSSQRCAPTLATIALGWFNQAANGGVSYQRVTESQAHPIPGTGRCPEGYKAIKGGQFTTSERTTPIHPNVTDRIRSADLTPLAAGKPKSIEVLTVPDFLDANGQSSLITVAPAAALNLPPYSLTRVIWV